MCFTSFPNTHLSQTQMHKREAERANNVPGLVVTKTPSSKALCKQPSGAMDDWIDKKSKQSEDIREFVGKIYQDLLKLDVIYSR